MGTAALTPEIEAPVLRRIDVDFMYLDLNTCSRCKGTDANLDAALAEVSRILGTAGAEVSVYKTLIASEEQARAHRFFSSPTIRVNGNDIALEFRENRCRDCEECACNGAIDCRVWVWQGHEYEEAPVSMIVDSAAGGLWRFAAARRRTGANRRRARQLEAVLRGHGATGGRQRELLRTQRTGRMLRAGGEGVLLRRDFSRILRLPLNE